MSTQDPRDESQTPDELLAETRSVLGEDAPAAGDPREGESTVAPRRADEPHEGTGEIDGKHGDGSRQQQAADPATVKGGSGMSAGMWVSLIIGAVIVVLLLIFIVQNNVTAQFQYFGWQFQLPLGVAMLFAAIGGILIAGLIGSVRIFILSRRLRKITKALSR